MKVGTDGVLLGAWVGLDGVSPLAAPRLLDVGTGTGMIALMLAQRLEQAQSQTQISEQNVIIDAVEIDGDAARQAAENVARSPWPDWVRVICAAVQSYGQRQAAQYDLIVANPPYFVDSFQAPDPARAIARHATTLSFEELCVAVNRLLKSTGALAVILPADQFSHAQKVALRYKLRCRRCCWIKPTPQLPPKRVLLTFAYQPGHNVAEGLTLELSRHNRTPAFRQLVQDFYLNP